MTPQELVAAALEARSRAYAPYSHYQVGAAVLTRDGSVVVGCNVENAAYPATICAERVALTSAVAQGKRDFVAIAVATANGGTPCGTCRQVMAEFCGNDFEIVLINSKDEIKVFSLNELLPHSFGGEGLR